MEYSHTYASEVRWLGERVGGLHFPESRVTLQVATAPEFGGPPGFVSPEDLFVAAAAACYLTTFLAMADKIRASFVTFTCRVEATLEKVEGQGLIFTSLVLKPRVSLTDLSEERPVTKALELAKKFCLVTNSMSCRVELQPTIQVV